MSYSRGDVVLVDFPNSDLSSIKRRPALVVQNTTVFTGLPQLVLALITSNVNRTGPTRVQVKNFSPEAVAMGLVTDSVIVADNLATVTQIAIRRRIGVCGVMQQVNAALRLTLGI